MKELNGFYDNQIKLLCSKCSRLLIIAINAVFKKNHSHKSSVVFLDKEQNTSFDNPHYMDMFVKIEDTVYHIEFQLLSGQIAIRMYEYAIKSTIRAARDGSNNGAVDYELVVTLPEQLVVFLSGKNRSDFIKVVITAPDGNELSYTIPCVSASESVRELSEKQLYLLIPFQQVQLNDRMNVIKNSSDNSKKQIAKELIGYHMEVLHELNRLEIGDIISKTERLNLEECFLNVEQYLADKDITVKQEVDNMGDIGYISWSDRLRNEGKEEGKAEGIIEGRAEGKEEGRAEGKIEGKAEGIIEGKAEGEEALLIRLVCKKLAKGMDIPDIADVLEEDISRVSTISKVAESFAPTYNTEAIYKALHP